MDALEAIDALTALPADYGPVDQYRDFRRVFATADGQRVLKVIMRLSGVLSMQVNPADPVTPSPEHTQWQAGAREVGLSILQILQNDPNNPG